VVGPQEQRGPLAAQQHRPQHGAQRGRAHRGAEVGGDALGPRVGLRHGVSAVRRGQRTALGVIFQDAR
jgi:hypothetical protein